MAAGARLRPAVSRVERQAQELATGGPVDAGPDLAGVSRRREADWLRQMIRDPSAMIAKGDPVVTQLVDRYNRIVMPNLGLDEAKTEALLAYLSERDARGTEAVPRASRSLR